MGVKGLCSLLEDYSQIYQNIHLRDSKLLVDGNNLAYWLYFTSNLDQNHARTSPHGPSGGCCTGCCWARRARWRSGTGSVWSSSVSRCNHWSKEPLRR
uniref:Uncharacterized protein n=1 Tax=Gadus morhua TaxID=8049 RepID=A0A8C5CI21_GADMO